MAKNNHYSTPIDPRLDGKGAATGNQYQDENYTNPWNVGIDKVRGSGDERTLLSPTSTTEGMGAIPVHGLESYDSNWEFGTGSSTSKPAGPRKGTRWTPKGKGQN